MKRQTASIIAATLLCSVAATPVVADFNGFYVGAAIGGSFGNGTENASTTADADVPWQWAYQDNINQANSYNYLGSYGIDFPDLNTNRNGLRKNSFAGSIFAGYGFGCEPFYIGAEIFVKGANFKTRSSNSDSSGSRLIINDGNVLPGPGAAWFGSNTTQSLSSDTHIKLNPIEFGIDLRPGVLLTCDTLLYGRVGVTWNKISVRTDSSASVTFNSATPDIGFSAIGATAAVSPALTVGNSISNKKTKAAFRVGGGLEQIFCDCLAVRLDYTFTYYGKVCVSGENSATGFVTTVPAGVAIPVPVADLVAQKPTITLADSREVKVYSNTILLGLSYYW